MSEQQAEQQAQVISIPIDRLADSPYQPRTSYDPDNLRELTDSIRHNGVLQPCPVRQVGPNNWELIGGHTRKRAAIAAGLTHLPCIVKSLSDEQARLLVVLDNLARADFLPWEEGAAYAGLRAGGLTVDGIAQQTGRSAQLVAARIAVAGVGKVLQKLYINKELTLYALEQIADLPDETMSPKRCSRCQGVNREDAEKCAGCGNDLSHILALPVGNPQEAAAQLCRNKPNGQVADVLKRVKQSYGLDRQVVQTSLGLSVDEIAQEAVETRLRFERMLEEVGAIGTRLCKDTALAELRSATATQKASVLQRLEAAQAILRALAQELTPATGQLLEVAQ